jgi:hypothetical protein
MITAADRPLDDGLAVGASAGTLRSGPADSAASGSDMLCLLECRLHVGDSIVAAAAVRDLTPRG